MHLSRIHEDLDDKDEFVRDCYTCRTTPNSENMPGFHEDHIRAGQNASKGHKFNWSQRRASDKEWSGLFHKEMKRLGYTYEDGHWAKPIKEDLDDVDKFERDCNYCREQDVLISLTQGISAIRPDIDEFHEIHTAARQAASKVGQYGTQEYKDKYESVMNQHRYYYVPGSHGSYWVKEYAWLER